MQTNLYGLVRMHNAVAIFCCFCFLNAPVEEAPEFKKKIAVLPSTCLSLDATSLCFEYVLSYILFHLISKVLLPTVSAELDILVASFC